MEQKNRIYEAWLKWKQREELHPELVAKSANDPRYARIKIKELNLILSRYPQATNADEKFTKIMLKLEKSRLMAVGYKRKRYQLLFWLSKPLRLLRDRIIINREQKNEFAKLDHLRDSMSRSGFGHYADQAMEKIKKGAKDFNLSVPFENNDLQDTNFKLNIKHDPDTGHKLESIEVTYVDKLNPGVVRRSEMPIGFELSATRRAANLIAGRSVLERYIENGISKSRWAMLDFTDKDAKGNYRKKYYPASNLNVAQSCQNSPLWEKMSPRDQINFVSTLQNGERFGFSIDFYGKPMKLYAEANPAKDSISWFNEKGKAIQLEKVLAEPKNSLQGQANATRHSLNTDLGKNGQTVDTVTKGPLRVVHINSQDEGHLANTSLSGHQNSGAVPDQTLKANKQSLPPGHNGPKNEKKTRKRLRVVHKMS